MENLIKVVYDNDRITVSARELHGFLGIESNFTTWFRRMCEYGFEQEIDFIPFLEKVMEDARQQITNSQLRWRRKFR